MDLSHLRAPDVAYTGLLPLILLVAAALAILLLDAFVPRLRGRLGVLGVFALALALAGTLSFLGAPPAAPFPGMFASDDFALVFDVVFLLAALAAAALSVSWHPALRQGEYHALLLLATAGMISLAHAASLVTVFLALELLSVVLYVLSGFLVERLRSLEAALKYFFLGAFSSAFLVYGMAFVYGGTGSFDIGKIAARLTELRAQGAPVPALVAIGGALLLVGFGFKISSVPFHMWTPDVYEGAPTPVAAFMSVGTKAAAFAAMLRVFTHGLGEVTAQWRGAVAGIAVATMLVGNAVALTQRNLKRMLAFSSIAHAGYALIGVVAWANGGRQAVLFYLVAYTFMNLGAFGTVAALERRGEGLHQQDLAGLARRRPLTALAMALFLLSLAGVPPTAGFVGKFNLFLAAVEAGWTKLAVLAVIYSVIAAYFYLRIIVVMYMQPEPPASVEPLSPVGAASAVVLALAALGVVALGIAPAGLLALLEHAASSL